MINKKSLELNFYEYFKYCSTYGAMKAGAVITDKQYVFYTCIVKEDYSTHDDIWIKLENAIHPADQRDAWDAFRDHNAHVFSVGKELIIDLPRNNQLSMSQLDFISEILDQTDKYNQEVEDNNKIKIDIFGNESSSLFDVKDINEAKEKLRKIVTKKVIIEEEKIIGKTCNKEELKSNLIFHIGLEECKTIKELTDTLFRCGLYYQDSYYQEVFSKIFPKYHEITYLVGVLRQLNIGDEKVQNVTFDNVKEVIYNSIKNLFKNKKTYNEVRKTMELVCSIPEDKIVEFFPNFKLVSALILDIFPYNKEEEKIINESLSNASNYEELSKIIFKLVYARKQEKLSDKEKKLLSMTKSRESMKQTKNIIAHKDELNKLIKRKQELDQQLFDCETEINIVENSFNTQKINMDNHNIIIADSSNNIFKRIINRKKIKYSKTIVNESDLKAKKLELQKEELIKKTNKIKEELVSIEKKFKTITNLDYFPSNESFMQIYYEQDYSLSETELENSINKLTQNIERLKKELDELIQTGLIIFDDNKLEDNNIPTISEFETNKSSNPKL